MDFLVRTRSPENIVPLNHHSHPKCLIEICIEPKYYNVIEAIEKC